MADKNKNNENKTHFEESVTLSNLTSPRVIISQLQNSRSQDDEPKDYHSENFDFSDTVLETCEQRQEQKEIRNIIDNLIDNVLDGVEAEKPAEKNRLISDEDKMKNEDDQFPSIKYKKKRIAHRQDFIRIPVSSNVTLPQKPEQSKKRKVGSSDNIDEDSAPNGYSVKKPKLKQKPK